MSITLWMAAMVAAIWTVAQVLAACAILSDELRGHLVVWKNPLGVVFFLVAAIGQANAFKPNRYGLLALAFPVYAAFRLWAHTGFEDPVVPLYFAWWWGFFVVIPAVFASMRDHRTLIACILISALFSTVFGVVLGAVNDMIYWWDHERIVFAFTNPNYFAYGGIGIALGAFFLLGQGKGHQAKALCWMMVTLGAAIVLGARARNGILFALTFILTYVVVGRRRRLMISSLVGVGLLAVVIGVGSELSDRLDELSSRRLTLWGALIEEKIGDMSVSEMLLGVGGFEQTILVSNDAVVAGARLNRAHSDNAYLDLFLSLGLTGVALFVGPLLLVGGDLVNGRRNREDDPGAHDSRVAVATLAGLLAQGIVVSNIPSFGNLMNVLCLSLVMGVWGREYQLRRLQTKRRATATRLKRQDSYAADHPLAPAEPARA